METIVDRVAMSFWCVHVARATTRFVSVRCAMVMLLAGLFVTTAHASNENDPHAAHRQAMTKQAGASTTRVVLPDVTLRNADGTRFRLAPDSFGGRVVVVDFVYTTCTTICPALTSVMASVQRGLGDRIGKEVLLVSITVDPVRDTPEVMRAYAKRVGAGRNWLWLTGSRGDITRVLRAFGLTAGRPDDHPPYVLVGDPASDRWMRWVGVPTPVAVTDGVHDMLSIMQKPRAPVTHANEHRGRP